MRKKCPQIDHYERELEEIETELSEGCEDSQYYTREELVAMAESYRQDIRLHKTCCTGDCPVVINL